MGASLIRALRGLLRLEIRHTEHIRRFWDRGENAIVVFWHGRMLLLPYAYGGPRGVRVLISSSRDGELIARTIGKFGLGTIRGSSTRGGERARAEMREALAEGLDIGITPDGPRGPRYVLKPGAIELARESGRPIVPLLMSSTRGRRLGSWDGFFVPLPGDRVIMEWGPAIHISADEDFEAARLRVEQALNELRWKLDAETGNPDPGYPQRT